jgi:hypothetical protein
MRSRPNNVVAVHSSINISRPAESRFSLVQLVVHRRHISHFIKCFGHGRVRWTINPFLNRQLLLKYGSGLSILVFVGERLAQRGQIGGCLGMIFAIV